MPAGEKIQQVSYREHAEFFKTVADFCANATEPVDRYVRIKPSANLRGKFRVPRNLTSALSGYGWGTRSSGTVVVSHSLIFWEGGLGGI